METRLRNLLHDLATEMPVDIEGSARPTLRKARGRRAVTAIGAGLAVVALVAVSVTAFRLAADPTVPAVTGPNPQPERVEPLWPETDVEAIAATQAAVDEGHQPLRTTPDGTATLLATNLLGWDLRDVRAEVSQERRDEAVVMLSNERFGAGVPPIAVGLRRFGRSGSDGIWSVVEARSLLLEPVDADTTRGVVHLTGEVPNLYEAAPALEAHVFDGPTLAPALGFARHELTDRTFDIDVDVRPTPDGRASLLLTMPDAVGASLGAVLTAVDTPIGELPSTGVDVTGVPPDVAATAQRIYDAAKAHDFDALAALLDPNTFIYNLDDGSDPIPAWRAEPSELDLMVAILEMPPTSRDIGEGYGTFYFWPYLVKSDFTALTEQERADLAALGYTGEDIRLIAEGETGYQGPRLAIDGGGDWRNFITVGE